MTRGRSRRAARTRVAERHGRQCGKRSEVVASPPMEEPAVTPRAEPALTPQDLRAQVAGREWYHTLELAPGVVTPGWFDTRGRRGTAPDARARWPARAASTSAPSTASGRSRWSAAAPPRSSPIDVPRPARPGTGRSAARPRRSRRWRPRKRGGARLRGRAAGARLARASRSELSVYDLDPAAVGRFDFVYLGSLLLHLRDPVRALERVRAVCGGRLLLVDAIDLACSPRSRRAGPLATLDGDGRPWWWQPNAAAARPDGRGGRLPAARAATARAAASRRGPAGPAAATARAA